MKEDVMSKHQVFQESWMQRFATFFEIDPSTPIAKAVEMLVDKGEHAEAVELLFGGRRGDIITFLSEQPRAMVDLEVAMFLQLYVGNYPSLTKLIAKNHQWSDNFKAGWFIQAYAEPNEVLWMPEPHATTLWKQFFPT